MVLFVSVSIAFIHDTVVDNELGLYYWTPLEVNA